MISADPITSQRHYPMSTLGFRGTSWINHSMPWEEGCSLSLSGMPLWHVLWHAIISGIEMDLLIFLVHCSEKGDSWQDHHTILGLEVWIWPKSQFGKRSLDILMKLLEENILPFFLLSFLHFSFFSVLFVSFLLIKINPVKSTQIFIWVWLERKRYWNKGKYTNK